MPEQVTIYQCPSCGGPLHYVGASEKLECDYCSSKYTVEQVEAIYEEKNAQAAAEGKEWDESALSDEWGADGARLRVYQCPACGAELICEESTAASSCPYCSNPAIIPKQFADTLKPDFVIPFKLNKDEAIAALKDYYKDKKLLPSAFSDENHIAEIKGVYVPFWLFDGEGYADMRFDASVDQIYTTSSQRVISTSHYDVRRAGVVSFDKIPVDASKQMPDDYMDSIEPFDYAQLKPFSMAYLPGFMADKYNVSVDECAARADERAAETVEDIMRSDVRGYTRCTCVSKHIQLHRGKVHYALLPVWLLNTKWHGENFLFAVNGQSGKLAGKLPIDKGKVVKSLLLTAVITAIAVATGLSFLL